MAKSLNEMMIEMDTEGNIKTANPKKLADAKPSKLMPYICRECGKKYDVGQNGMCIDCVIYITIIKNKQI